MDIFLYFFIYYFIRCSYLRNQTNSINSKTMRIKSLIAIGILSSMVLASSCKKNPETAETKEKTGYQGQGKSPVVPTVDKPVQKQWRGVWAFNDSTTFFSNKFDGARLNGVAYDGDDHYTIWVTAENTPINVSPWYGFQVWSSEPRDITVQLNYQDSRSRYYPKISTDGKNFKPLDSLNFKAINPGDGEFGIKAAPESAELTISVNENPTWITAQELYTSSVVQEWVDSLSQNHLLKIIPLAFPKKEEPCT